MLYTRAGRNQVANNNVLLQSLQSVFFSGYRRLGQDLCGLLERGCREETLG